MNVETSVLYAGTVVVLCLTPGPNGLLALTNGARYGARRAIYSTLGCASGLCILIAACLAGLGALLAVSETAFAVLKIVGCVYLVWIGVSIVRDRSALTRSRDVGAGAGHRSAGQLYLQGLLVVITNPKVLLFFSAFLPQFYSAEHGFWSLLAVLAGTFVLVEVCLEVGLSVFAERILRSLGTPRRRRGLNLAMGGLFISAGAALLLAERPR